MLLGKVFVCISLLFIFLTVCCMIYSVYNEMCLSRKEEKICSFVYLVSTILLIIWLGIGLTFAGLKIWDVV